MNYNQQMTSDIFAAGAIQERNRVLRNTYWLLALSMVPTVLGAFLGVYLNFAAIKPMYFLGIFLVGSYGLMFAVEKNKNSIIGVVLLMVFTFFMGLMLSRLVGMVLGRYSNGPQLIALAFGGTGGVFFVMASLATIIKRDLSPIGKWLSVGSLLALAACVCTFFFSFSSPMMLTLLVLIMGISSAFLLYQVQQIVNGGERNYISATLSVYISLFNIFQSLLSILSILSGRD